GGGGGGRGGGGGGFRPSWIFRDPVASVGPVKLPNDPDVRTAVGTSQKGVLVRFVASARICRLTRSVTANLFDRDMSMLNVGARLKKLRPVLPMSPARVAVSLSFVDCSKNCTVPAELVKMCPSVAEHPVHCPVLCITSDSEFALGHTS